MSPLLLAAVLSVGGAAEDRAAGGERAAGPNVQGRWLIVYAEEGGRRNNSWEQRQATVRGNTLTYEEEGKTHSIQLKFGPNQTLSAVTSAGGKEGKDEGEKG